MNTMVEPESNLADAINLLQLEWRGVRIRIKEPPEIHRRSAGEYSFFSHEIALQKAIIPYWFVTLTTLLHEYGHHQQRFLVYVIFLLSIILGIGVYAVNSFIPYAHYVMLYGLTLGPLFVSVVILKIFHFEQDADRHMIRIIPDVIILVLSQIEAIEIAGDIGKESLQRTMMDLHREMRRFFPELLG